MEHIWRIVCRNHNKRVLNIIEVTSLEKGLELLKEVISKRFDIHCINIVFVEVES